MTWWIVILVVYFTALTGMYLYVHRNRVYTILDRHFDTSNIQSILDVGCGACCNVARFAEARSVDVTYLDVVDAGKCHRPRIFDGEHIPFEDKTYDLGILSYVLHHTKKQDALLLEMKRVCKRVLVIEDTPLNIIEWGFAGLHARSSWGMCRECFHSIQTWEKIFDGHGFDILGFGLLPWWYLPFSYKPLFYPVTSSYFILG